MLIVGHTRFSLHAPDSGAWVASNGSKLGAEEYLKHLYSDERMGPRCDIFFNYTLPMLSIAADGFRFRHVVSYSDNLPAAYQEQLEAAAGRFPFLILDRVNTGGGSANVARIAKQVLVQEGLPETSVFGSMRLDDDDVLSADYFSQMVPYLIEGHVGFVVSLSRGVTAIYDGGTFHYARDAVFPLHSKGHLSVCRFDESGNLHAPVSAPHNKADRFNPVIIDSRKISHLWVRSISQDTSLYQLEQGKAGMIARIYLDMDQYPALSISVKSEFPVLDGRIHGGKPESDSTI